MRKINSTSDIQFSKSSDGLVPVVIQNAKTFQVLMLGYMNKEAYEVTIASGEVTFYSRSKNRLWKKGETSGNVLKLLHASIDCDQDALLMLVDPVGPTCHTGDTSCWGNESKESLPFLNYLETIIDSRLSSSSQDSYTKQIVSKGISKVAQKVGEEAVETVIEAVKGDIPLQMQECADLLFHILVLLKAQDLELDNVLEVLRERHK